MDFETAVKTLKTLASSPTNDEKLTLYGLYKQATVGDNTTAQPGMFDFAGSAKWTAWNNVKGTTQDKAKKKYIAVVGTLIAKYGVTPLA